MICEFYVVLYNIIKYLIYFIVCRSFVFWTVTIKVYINKWVTKYF